jgi:hypothetical protein
VQTTSSRATDGAVGGFTAATVADGVRGALIISTTILLLWSWGYRAITGDHHQYLLPALRRADPSFAVGDWFIEQTTAYHYSFQHLLTAAERFGVTTATLTVLHVLTLAVLCLGLGSILRSLDAPWWSVPLALLTLRFGVQRTWGDVMLVGETALPHYAGVSLALWAVAATTRRSFGLAAALFVATAYVHVSVGVWTGLVLGLMILAQAAHGAVTPRRLLRPVIAAFFALIPLLVQAGQDFAGSGADPEVYRLLFHARSPHHYSFVDFGLANHARAGLVIAIAIVGTRLVGTPAARSLRTAVLAIAGIGLAGAFFLHISYWPLPIRLFPYRLAPLMTGIAAAVSVALISRASSTPRTRLFGLLASLSLLAAGQPRVLAPLNEAFRERPSHFIHALIAATVLVMLALALHARSQQTFGIPPDKTWVIPSLAAATLILVFAQPPTFASRSLSEQQRELGQAVSEIVPVGEVVLVPPEVDHLRITARRGIVVDFKSFPMVGDEMLEWRHRLQDVSGTPVDLDGGGGGGGALRARLSVGYGERTLAELERAGRRYGASFVLVHEDSVAGRSLASGPADRSWPLGDHRVARIRSGASS